MERIRTDRPERASMSSLEQTASLIALRAGATSCDPPASVQSVFLPLFFMSLVPLKWSVIRAHAFELGADGARDALARCVALRAPAAGRMKEYERVVLQVAMHDRHDVAGSHE